MNILIILLESMSCQDKPKFAVIDIDFVWHFFNSINHTFHSYVFF